jgi:DNA-binding MarR family transcriptional regulator
MNRRGAAAEALTELILEVFRLNGRLLAAGDRITSRFGQTSARWQVLGAIPDEPRTVADIARVMGLTRQSVQRTADLLEEDGLVEYAENPAHRRAKLVRLTPRGRRLLDRIDDAQAEWANHLAAASGLDEREVRRTLRVASRFREAAERN